jgi:hypothetical protein
MRRFRRILLAAAVWVVLAPGEPVSAQPFRRGGTEFTAKRSVVLPADKEFAIVVAEFFHHGQIAADGRNVVVAGAKALAPTRVMQLGPGDYCRLAFQTIDGERTYEILYGGDPPDAAQLPPWTARGGLVLETREYRQCNLNSLESVRAALESSTRIGSDYVDNVQHSHNPFALKPAPFLSHYSGYLQVPAAGLYGFLTSSQDCSFLLIDDALVVDAPGRHQPARRALRGSRKDVRLSAGPHKFDYYHAASGPVAMMVAAWEVSPGDPKPAPVAIPSDAFRSQVVGRVQPGPVETKAEKVLPDFLVDLSGSVPLPESDLQLIGVRLKNVSPQVLMTKSRYLWDFGDGQTSDQQQPQHVYLRPGLYTIRLTVRRGVRPYEMANRVYLDEPKILKAAEFHVLDQYLPLLKTYDPAKLDAASLRQLVTAYTAKADTIMAPAADAKAETGEEQEETETQVAEKAAQRAKEAAARKAEAAVYIDLAVQAGKVALVGQSAAAGDDGLGALARLVGPMARDQLGDSRLAAQIWNGAAEKISRGDLKAECELAAADIALNDLLDAPTAKTLLEAAGGRLGQGQVGPVASRLQRVWGDYYAATGDGQAAREAYRRAEAVLRSSRSHIERTAWRGAHSRSVEQFLTSGEMDRAAGELRAWQQEFPDEKVDGYMSLLFARYWAGRRMEPQAISLADQLLAVNADSPYVDQLLFLAADCEVKRDRVDRALATLNSLVEDYPGSPLVPTARERIAELGGGQKK